MSQSPEKCCKPAKCKSEPACPSEPLDTSTIGKWTIGFVAPLLILRFLYIKQPDYDALKKKSLGRFWFGVWFILQYFFMIFVITTLYATVTSQVEMMNTLNYYWKGLQGTRITNYIMEWLGLQALDLFVWNSWCVISIGFIILLCLLINVGLLIMIFIIGGYLIGYTHF